MDRYEACRALRGRWVTHQSSPWVPGDSEVLLLRGTLSDEK